MTEVPTDLVRALFSAERPVLPSNGRELALKWLEHSLVDFQSLDEHIALLKTLYSSTFRYPRPRRDTWSSNQLMSPATETTFRYTNRLPDSSVMAIIEGGPNALKDPKTVNDDMLGELLLNPFALYDLFDVIDDLLPDAWLPLMNKTGRELVQEHNASSVLPKAPAVADKSPDRTVSTPPSRIGRRWWIASAATLAASVLLIGMLLDHVFFGSPDGTARAPEVTVALGKENVRNGSGEEERLEIKSSQPGFAMIVILTPGKRQEVIPGISGEPIRINPSEVAFSPPFPAAATHGTAALVIVTRSPADGPIRRALADLTYTPNQIGKLEADLRTALESQNFRPIAFTRIGLIPLSKTK